MSTRPPHLLFRLLPAPRQCVELFALFNLGFLALDIYLAHSINHFASLYEWIPFAFSLAAPPVLIIAYLIGGLAPLHDGRTRSNIGRFIGHLVGWTSVIVGIAGLVFHLNSQFFASGTLRSLVYTAPFAAPLAYTGVGLLLVMNRMIDHPNAEWAGWVLMLTVGGFIGNFVLSLADHAQNGFWKQVEWTAVIAAAFAIGFLLVPLIFRIGRGYVLICFAVMGAEMGVGLAGEAFHVMANLKGGSPRWLDNFIYGAPAFAPLLFNNIALLGCIGLWALCNALAANAETIGPRRISSEA